MRGRGGGVGRLGTLAGAGCRGMETSLPLLHYSEEPEQEQGFEAEERSQRGFHACGGVSA